MQQALKRYDAALLRAVGGKLFKPRSQWPVDELIARSLAAINNVAVVDRRLRESEQASRRLLAVIGHSRQPRWRVGNLVEALQMLGEDDGVRPILDLLHAGLLYPELPAGASRLRDFKQWLAHAGTAAPVVFAHPAVTARAVGEKLGLPALIADHGSLVAREADGLEWPLRIAVLWQRVKDVPLRRTQQGDFFKRDWERLTADGLLNAPLADGFAELPDLPWLLASLAEIEGALRSAETELQEASLPSSWQEGLLPALESLWAALPWLDGWGPQHGRRIGPDAGSANPYPSAYLLSLLLLSQLPDGAWAEPAAIAKWIEERHPYWNTKPQALAVGAISPSRETTGPSANSGLDVFLLGVAHQLRLVEVGNAADGQCLVRLTAVGRWLLGIGDPPPLPQGFPQTLLVQPNLEIVAYRQGLTPGLIADLSQLAAWKSLGPACTLQLQPETVYGALQSGQTFETIRQTLERHAVRELPAAVIDSLRTWSNKRERIAVYPSGTLFEFATPEDLNEALARRLPLTRLADRWAVAAGDSQIDFRHFRLTGTRDYALPPERCVEVGEDGVTLSVDLARSDLLVESELQRFAELAGGTNLNGRRQYRLTPTSLTAARDSGVTVRALDDWFMQRAGQPLSAAGRLLLTGGLLPAAEARRQLVLHVPTPDFADGLPQWPGTRGLILARLGPTALAIAEENVEALRKVLQTFGVGIS